MYNTGRIAKLVYYLFYEYDEYSATTAFQDLCLADEVQVGLMASIIMANRGNLRVLHETLDVFLKHVKYRDLREHLAFNKSLIPTE